MYYILYQHKKGTQERGWQGFRSREDAINFLMKNAKNYLTWKIIEAEKEYEFKLIEKREGINVTCKDCGQELAQGNVSGRCGRCASGARLKTSKRTCEFEGCTNKIASWNKSGLCSGCVHRRDSAYHVSKRKETRFVTRELEKGKKEKIMGKCKRPECGKEFELEDWQHSSLHWCPVCRNSPAYKDFKEVNRQRS